MIPTERLALPIMGKVLQPFPFRVAFPIREGWEFSTDVIPSDDGAEQRIADRDPARPRRNMRVRLDVFDRGEASALQALLFGWGRFPFGAPLWYDAMRLAGPTEEGDDELTVDDATGRDLAERLAAGLDVPALIWRAFDDWEPALLSDVDGNTLELSTPVTREWPVRTLVVPMRLMSVGEVIEKEAAARAVRSLELEFVESGFPAGAATDCMTDTASAPPRVLMVRGTDAIINGFVGGNALDHVNADADNIPQQSDPPEEHILQGYTAGLSFSIGSYPQLPMLVSQRGRATAAKFCTTIAPVSMKGSIIGLALGDVIGDDATLSIVGVVQMPGIPDLGNVEPGASAVNMFTVEAALTGSGYAPAPGPTATVRNFKLAGASLQGGPRLMSCIGYGTRITSFGVYDVGAPGGIRSETPDDWGGTSPIEFSANATAVVLHHGFCVRCRRVENYKGVKIVVEEVLRDEEGEETGLFGTPDVSTHDFTAPERALDNDVAGGIFFAKQCGGNTLFGQAHDGEALEDGGVYKNTLADELYRVTVSLYDEDDIVFEQFRDIFPTMLVEAEVVA
jgi:hypothetical protein